MGLRFKVIDFQLKLRLFKITCKKRFKKEETLRRWSVISTLVYCNKNFRIQSTFTGTAAGHRAALFDSYRKPGITTNTHISFYSFISHKHTAIIWNKHTDALTSNPSSDHWLLSVTKLWCEPTI